MSTSASQSKHPNTLARSVVAVVATCAVGFATYWAVADDSAQTVDALAIDDSFYQRAGLSFSIDEETGERFRIELPHDVWARGSSESSSGTKTELDDALNTETKDEDSETKDGDSEPKTTSEPADGTAPVKEPEAPKPPAADTTAPEIKILHPKNDSHHQERVIVFEGSSEPGSLIKAGAYQADVDSLGNWRIQLVLSPGANGVRMSATDAAGNVGVDNITVYLDAETEIEPQEPEPKEDPEPAEVEFRANQKYGSSEAEIPYEKFWGKATPNSRIEVSSQFGSGATEANENGEWFIKVYFPEAPRGQYFAITVAGVNGSKTFEFVAKEFEAPEPKEDVPDKPAEGASEATR